MNHKIDRDTYIIPPNFIESGTFFGGMFKARNVIEAGILAFVNCTPFVRQYGILSNKWGVLLCQKEYQTNDIRRNSKNW